MSDNEEQCGRRPRWATKTEAAQHLGVHPNTIARWADEGRIRRHRFGPRLIRFDLNEIDAMGNATAVRRP
ncbi:excisionase family DNA-binding protein [Mycobacterium sp. LTG2003]